MCLVTTSESADYKTLWKMMHKRRDIEENAFHQLKTYAMRITVIVKCSGIDLLSDDIGIQYARAVSFPKDKGF